MAQDLDYEWEAYEKGWRGQPQQIKHNNEQLNGLIQQLTQLMINAQKRLPMEIRNREIIRRRNLTGNKKRHKKVARKKKSNVMTPLEHANKRIDNIKNQVASYSKQIDRLNAQLNSNTYIT